MDDVCVFGVEDVGWGCEVFAVAVGVFVVVVAVASSGEDVLGDELRDEFAELAHVEGAAHAHVTSAATSSATATSAPATPAAPVVVMGASVVVGAVMRGAASARAAEGEAGTEGVFMGWRTGEVGWWWWWWRPLAGRWGWMLEGVVAGPFWGWGTGFFTGFWVVGGGEGVGGGCGVEGGDPVPEGVGGLIEEADVRHRCCCVLLLCKVSGIL